MTDIDAKTKELLNICCLDGIAEENILKCKILIHDIAEACRTTEIFKNSKDKYEEFKNGFATNKIVESYIWFLNRIVEAPTHYHMIGAVRLCLPIVDDFIQEASHD